MPRYLMTGTLYFRHRYIGECVAHPRDFCGDIVRFILDHQRILKCDIRRATDGFMALLSCQSL